MPCSFGNGTAPDSGSNIGGSLSGVTLSHPNPHAELLRGCFLAGVDAVLPEHCLPPALAAVPVAKGPTAVLAIGKAAPGMARAIHDALAAHGTSPAHSLVVGLDSAPGVVAGDHPVPGARSARASLAIEQWVGMLSADAEVHVAISGGTTSLIGAPRSGLAGTDLQEVFALLLRSGLEVGVTNALRKRLTRWGGGRLAAALAPRRTFAWVISDVPGDDPATIGSGPCSGDGWRSAELRELLQSRGIWQLLKPTVRAALEIESIKPGAAELGRVHLQIVASNHDAMAAAAAFAERQGHRAECASRALAGEAREAGELIANDLLRFHDEAGESPSVTVYGGETVVTLGARFGAGGRNQELALSAARALSHASAGADVVLLSAGTDGKDGSSTAAGAIVDGNTWNRIASCGEAPDALLDRHQSDRAFHLVEAQLHTGATGTNVMDLVVGANVKRVRSD